MKSSLPREHRRILESTVAQARAVAEDGAAKALKAMGVAGKEAQAHASPDQKKLRVQLRAHGRALGDVGVKDGSQSINHLVTEIAYEHWHRMLFARFLAESDLLMHPDGYPVSLADCKDDISNVSPPARSEWEVAGRYASAMLPNVFRSSSPVLRLQLPLETEQAMEALLAKLPATVFQADDSLGWSYQFWQAQKKEDVQRQMKQAGTKVGANELPAVTQLFTEQYMVAFLLENTLGAWMQSRYPKHPLPIDLPYFRKMEDGSPAAGSFPAWPDSLETFKLLDPCLGSGHFLVSAFHYLVPLRCVTENIKHKDAVDRVLADNLYGLELDARCVEIAAFALAMAAWRYPDENGNPLGYRTLPRMNIACVGLAPRSKKTDWLKLAEGDKRLEDGMAALYELFQKAPELGSLIDPKTATQGDFISAQWDELVHKLDSALAAKDGGVEDVQATEDISAAQEARVTARGMLHASRILTRKYHCVITNPPYLGIQQYGDLLKAFCEANYSRAKNELANVFLERCLRFCISGGLVSFVMPQNWLFLPGYKKERTYLLENETWQLLAKLGSGAFEMISGEVVKAILISIVREAPNDSRQINAIDVSNEKSPLEKANALANDGLTRVVQIDQLQNPDAIVSLEDLGSKTLLEKYAYCYQGLATSDNAQFIFQFWENIYSSNEGWVYFQMAPSTNSLFDGLNYKLCWENGSGRYAQHASALKAEGRLGGWKSGHEAWGRKGIALNRVGSLPVATYSGMPFDCNVAMLIPAAEEHVAAILCYCQSTEYKTAVRAINQKLSVTNLSLAKVPFDIQLWKRKAAERYPNGLPKPYSNDPIQWIFHGHPQPATDPLQVAVARLLGYQWPAESDDKMELSDEARAWIKRCKDFDSFVDDDGIVCLPAVRGEAAAVERLRALLAKAFGKEWSAVREAQLLKDAGSEGIPLAQWLRDKFFEQHVSRFQKRPFIWHVWDGHKDGFSALLNYHSLTRAKLQTLIHTYLGDWITQQRRAVDAGGSQAGEATLKLAKAEALKAQLEAIAQGEKPFDIFVRWKPLMQQPMGWDPDLNDGVRMNIRPFVQAGVLRINQTKLGIKWESDRGKDVASAPWFKLGPTYGEPEGTRINNHHLSLAEKQAARNKK
jgi:hypothetical protein